MYSVSPTIHYCSVLRYMITYVVIAYSATLGALEVGRDRHCVLIWWLILMEVSF